MTNLKVAAAGTLWAMLATLMIFTALEPIELCGSGSRATCATAQT